MAITINGDTGVSGVDGTVSNPALEGSDPNTGLYFPAADTVAIGTNGSERMRVDSSGNVGVGTSSPASKLHVAGSFRQTGATVPFEWTVNAGAADFYKLNAVGYADNLIVANSSGNIGIGTNNPSYKMHVNGTGSFGGQLWVANSGSDFSNGINLSGAGSTFIVGTSSDGASSTIANVKIASWFGLGFSSAITGQTVPYGQNAGWINCRDGAMSIRGSLTQNASDRRLKENLEIIPDALGKINQINGYTFDWKMDECFDLGFKPAQEHEHGVIAQEIQTVIPDAVVIAPFDNECGEDGVFFSKSGENYLTVKIEKLIPLLLQGIKELKAELDELKAKVG